MAPGPATTENGPETAPIVILWEQPELSLTTPLGLTLWSAVRVSWSQWCMHKLHSNKGRPTWDQFSALGRPPHKQLLFLV